MSLELPTILTSTELQLKHTFALTLLMQDFQKKKNTKILTHLHASLPVSHCIFVRLWASYWSSVGHYYSRFVSDLQIYEPGNRALYLRFAHTWSELDWICVHDKKNILKEKKLETPHNNWLIRGVKSYL